MPPRSSSVCTLQFVLTMRGAQIDPALCFLTTLSLYALLRHLLLGPGLALVLRSAASRRTGVITKGVGFLPLLVLIPFFLMRGFGWQGLAPVDAARVAGAGGSRRGDSARRRPVARADARRGATSAAPEYARIATKSCSSRPSAVTRPPGIT